MSPERLDELEKKSRARDVFTLHPDELDFLILRTRHADSAERDVTSLAKKLDAADRLIEQQTRQIAKLVDAVSQSVLRRPGIVAATDRARTAKAKASR